MVLRGVVARSLLCGVLVWSGMALLVEDADAARNRRRVARVVVAQEDVRQITVRVRRNGRMRNVRLYCLDTTPGKLKRSGESFLFTPYSELLRQARARGKGGTKVANLRAMNKAGRKGCRKANNDGGAQVTPTPTRNPNSGGGGGGNVPPTPTRTPNSNPGGGGQPTPTRTPTPTPTPQQQRIFDAAGNFTAYGKQRAGIPQNVNGNFTQGKTLWESFYGCSGCHPSMAAVPYNASWSQLRTALTTGDMYFPNTPDGHVASLLAYLWW